MTHLSQAMFNSMGIAEAIKWNAPIAFCSLAYGKLNTVVRQDRMDPVGHSFDKT